MKRIMKLLLCTILSVLMCIDKVQAADTLRITQVYATFLDETIEVTRRIMEVDGGMAEPVKLDIRTTGGGSSKTYTLIQYDGKTQKIAASSSSNRLEFDPTNVDVGLPLYITVKDNTGQQTTKMVNFRIHTGAASKQVSPTIESEFGSGIVIDLSDKLPGCKFSFLPFAIPVTAKQYADGRIVLGIGYNHSDAKFWADVAVKDYPAMDNFEAIRDVVLAEEAKAWTAGKPKNIGLLVSFSGWAEYNVNPRQPARGKLQMYIGTGWATGGQYAILTWDVVITIGGSGSFEFSMVYNEAESKRTFQFDRVLVGALGGVEAFGGIGLYGLASVGIYGAGSLGANVEFLPTQSLDSIILAGEVGFKVKVLGKSVVTFTLISGSHDFINDRLTEGTVSLTDNTQTVTGYLLANDYANVKGTNLESGEMIWHNFVNEGPLQVTDGWEGDRDFAHLLAEDIYPDSHVQIVNTGSKAFPQMNVVFLGADNSRQAGNRSVAMNSYYNIATSFMSDPYPIDDNGTADYEPVVYHDPVSGNTYAVWKDAREEITEDMYLSDVASRTEIEFAEFQTGREWKNKKVLTNYNKKVWCATGASVSGDAEGNPVVTYFETPVGDPLAISGDHDVYLATRDSLGNWSTQKQFTISGNVNSVQNFWFRGAQTIASTVTDELGYSTVSLWQNGEKIWEKYNAGSGQFAFGGNNYRYFLWYQDGRFYVMDESGNEKPLTPENMFIPNGDYQFAGTLGAGKAVLIGRSTKDSSENAVALISQDGGMTWYQTPLTDIDANALVDHVSIAFTDEEEPIVVYSVQNYISNFDESRTLASTYFDKEVSGSALKNVPQISLSGEDSRFTDTQADLYIKARGANTHVSLQEGYVKDPSDLIPGSEAEFNLTVFNNGMYPVEHASILCEGKEVAAVDQTLMPGQSVQVPAIIKLPEDPGSEELVYTFDVTSGENKESESRIKVTVPGGHLTAAVDHIFEDLQEKMIYTVTNYGYTDKEFEVVVRDEDNGREVSREKHTLKGGSVYEGAAVSEKGMYAKEGCTNVTIYVLFEGEDYDSPSVDANRIKSVVPLEEIYGQPLPVTKGSTPAPVNPSVPDENENRPSIPYLPGYSDYSTFVPVSNKGKDRTAKDTDPDTEKESENKEDKDSKDNKDDKDSTGSEDSEPEKTPVESGTPESEDNENTNEESGETAPESSGRINPAWFIIPLAAAAAGGLWFILAKRRKDDEE